MKTGALVSNGQEGRVPAKFRIWIEARKRHKLTHAQIQMARELGMNPRKFGKLDNHRQEEWKLPLGQFIEKCYLKRFGKLPNEVFSIEQRIRLKERKKAARREAKRQRRESEASGDNGQTPDHCEKARIGAHPAGG